MRQWMGNPYPLAAGTPDTPDSERVQIGSLPAVHREGLRYKLPAS